VVGRKTENLKENYKREESRNCQNLIGSLQTLTIKGKAVPLQAWTGPEGSQEVKFPRFRDDGTGWW